MREGCTSSRSVTIFRDKWWCFRLLKCSDTLVHRGLSCAPVLRDNLTSHMVTWCVGGHALSAWYLGAGAKGEEVIKWGQRPERGASLFCEGRGRRGIAFPIFDSGL